MMGVFEVVIGLAITVVSSYIKKRYRPVTEIE
jgi:hypothetical protein